MYVRFHLSVHRTLALAAALVLVPAIAAADAVSDQKKALEKLGSKIDHPPAQCNLLTKAEAARFLGKPVQDGESAGILAGCAYRAADGSSDGILVTRKPRSEWSYPRYAKYQVVHGVGEKAYTYFEEPGYTAGALTSKGGTEVLVTGKAGVAKALAALRVAMNR